MSRDTRVLPPPKSFYDQMLENQKRVNNDNDQDLYLFDIDRKKYEDEHVRDIFNGFPFALTFIFFHRLKK